MSFKGFPFVGTLFVAAAIVAVFFAEPLRAKPLPAVLPPIPDSVISVIGWTPVLIIHDLHCGGFQALGCFTVKDHTIRMTDSMPSNVAWQTLEHEKLHMVLSDAGISIASETEDRLADALGSYRVLEMTTHLRK